MSIKYNDVLGVTEEALIEEGAFNAFVDIDSSFHVDPHLLEYASTPELRGSYQKFRDYFDSLIKILDASKTENDRFWREAKKRLHFKEMPYISLGYSKEGASGRGIGDGLASALVKTSAEIVEAGIKDPIIFELIGLFEEGIGADRISDMALSIVIPDILSYSARVAKTLNVSTVEIVYGNNKVHVPANTDTNEPLILVPREILSPLPVAYCWSDIDTVCSHNENLRNRLNSLIGETWGHATKRVSKKDLKSAIMHNPEALIDLIEQYREKPANEYDFNADPTGEFIWHRAGKEYVAKYPVDLSHFCVVDDSNIFSLVESICERFRDLVENNGLVELLYDKNKPKNERAAQLLFYGIADAYCDANNLDLNREPNAGRGPVDFKVSSGYQSRVNVEVKLTSNGKLIQGFQKQLPTYNKAEKTNMSIYLVIRNTSSEAGLTRLTKLRDEAIRDGMNIPKIIYVDGLKRPSASNL